MAKNGTVHYEIAHDWATVEMFDYYEEAERRFNFLSKEYTSDPDFSEILWREVHHNPLTGESSTIVVDTGQKKLYAIQAWDELK